MSEISLLYLLQLAWKRIWALILAFVLFGLGAFAYCKFVATPRYSASSSIIVTNGTITFNYSDAETGETGSINSSDISSSSALANTVVDLLKTPDVYIALSNELDGKYSYGALKGMISVAKRETGNLFIDIKTTSTNGNAAKDIANAFAEMACDYIVDYIPSSKAFFVSSALSFSKVYPNTTTITAVAAIIGAVLAFGIVFIADSLNQSIRGEDEFVARYKIPLLGSVPDFENDEVKGEYYSKKHKSGYGKAYKKGKAYTGAYEDSYSSASNNSDITTQKSAPFAVVEAYKTIRSNLMFLLEKREEGGNVITISSSNASEGKSTSATNLAVAFSQLENKILIIDADMRRSSLHKKLKIDNEFGLSSVLAGLTDFKSAVKQISENFHVLTAGQAPPNPSELLGSKAFADLIADLRKEYAYVIIDTPPINVVSDAGVLAPRTDGIVFVLRDGFTPNYTIKRAIATLEFTDTKILGAIMNGANPKSGNKYIYRKYSYRSRYYSNYYKYGYNYNKDHKK